MSNVYRDVEIKNVYTISHIGQTHFKLMLRGQIEGSVITKECCIDILSSNLKEKIESLVKKEKEREYFDFGLCDVDFYHSNNSYFILQSPDQYNPSIFELKKGEMERLISLLNLSIREKKMENLLNKMVEEINQAKKHGTVILSHDWNDDLEKLGLNCISKNTVIAVNEAL